MYGGLFGDLPAAKKSGSGDAPSNQEGGTGKAKDGDDKEAADKSAASSAAAKNSSSNFLFAPTAARKNAKLSKEAPAKVTNNSMLQTIGKAGTSMAFVPTAALKRKKPPATSANEGAIPAVKSLKTPIDMPATSSTSLYTVNGPQGISHQSSSLPASSLQHEMTVTTTMVRSSAKRQSATEEVIHIHGEPVGCSSNNATTADRNEILLDDAQDEEEEEITDPYDPYFPNDLLRYWERQAASEERARLEQETKEALENQRLLREQLDHERRGGLQSEGVVGESSQKVFLGDNTVVDLGLSSNIAGRGRGRGRGGVSNLPAWLVEKQRKETESAAGLGNAAEGGGSG